MALTIHDPETERMARELARRSGRPLDEAVGAAIRQAWECAPAEARTDSPNSPCVDPERQAELFERIRAIQRRVAALPDVDTRAADDLLGYDEHGLPS